MLLCVMVLEEYLDNKLNASKANEKHGILIDTMLLYFLQGKIDRLAKTE